MPAIDDLFAKLRAQKRKAVMPFVTAGDPDLAFTGDVIRRMAASGASICEVGVPYSDPIADGPVVQASYTRALLRGVTIDGMLQALRPIAADVPIPLVVMVSYAIVYRRGRRAFLEQAKAAGAAGAIVPDLPLDEAAELAKICRALDMSLIQLVTPTTPRDRALRIAEASSGFLYYVSVAGITGERTALPTQLCENVTWLTGQIDLPVCVGFGIATPEQARLVAAIADGVIVGSAIVRRIANAAERDRSAVLTDVGDFVADLVQAVSSESSAQ
jgi:tryptophan synthase alpha chain